MDESLFPKRYSFLSRITVVDEKIYIAKKTYRGMNSTMFHAYHIGTGMHIHFAWTRVSLLSALYARYGILKKGIEKWEKNKIELIDS